MKKIKVPSDKQIEKDFFNIEKLKGTDLCERCFQDTKKRYIYKKNKKHTLIACSFDCAVNEFIERGW